MTLFQEKTRLSPVVNTFLGLHSQGKVNAIQKVAFRLSFDVHLKGIQYILNVL